MLISGCCTNRLVFVCVHEMECDVMYRDVDVLVCECDCGCLFLPWNWLIRLSSSLRLPLSLSFPPFPSPLLVFDWIDTSVTATIRRDQCDQWNRHSRTSSYNPPPSKLCSRVIVIVRCALLLFLFSDLFLNPLFFFDLISCHCAHWSAQHRTAVLSDKVKHWKSILIFFFLFSFSDQLLDDLASRPL